MKRTILASMVISVLIAPAVIASDDTMSTGKPALIVMDTQNRFMPWMDEEDADAVRTINVAIRIFRQAGLPVIRVYHSDPTRGPEPGSDDFQFPETIEVESSDPMVVKSKPSAFNGTDLDRVLSDLGVDTVFLTGLSAVGCVLATYFDAGGRDFRTFMIKDGLLSGDAEMTDAVEKMTDAVSVRAVAYMLQNATK